MIPELALRAVICIWCGQPNPGQKPGGAHPDCEPDFKNELRRMQTKKPVQRAVKVTGQALCGVCGEPNPPSTTKPRKFCSVKCGQKAQKAKVPKHPRPPVLTPERMARIRELSEAGVSGRAAAKVVGVSASVVRRFLKAG